MINTLLSRLDKVKPIGRGQWKACCPAHQSTKQSLSIKDDNGKVLIHCFAEGCAIVDVLSAVGLTMDDIQPKLHGEHKVQKRPFYAGDVLEISRDEIMVAYLIINDSINGKSGEQSSQRLLKCASRLNHACDVANNGNGVNVAEIEKNQRIVERIVNNE